MSIIPRDAMEKVSAKNTDHYADLSAEERADEGLEAPKPAPAVAPAAAPEPESARAPEPEPAAEDVATVEQLINDIAALREDVQGALGTPEREAAEAGEDALLKEALEHEDPVVRQLGERLRAQAEQLAEIARRTSGLIQDRNEVELDAEFDIAVKSYTVGGQPLTDAHVSHLEDVMLARPDLARSLSVSDLVRVVFPDAQRITGSPAPKPPGKLPAAPGKNKDGEDVATIIDIGGGGAPAPEKWKPRPNESIESAVAAAGAALLNVRRR